MSYCSIHNIARVVNVRQAYNRNLPAAVNEPAPSYRFKSIEFGTGAASATAGGPRGQAAIGADPDPAASVIALFTSFFTQLFNLLTSKTDKLVPDSTPRPQVNPTVEPVVPPEPQPKQYVPIPNLSDKRNGAKPDNIWSGFRQGPDGNCVTVSAIKAAMYKFGQSPTDIYKEVIKTSDGYRVTMRDDFVLNLTDQELKIGAAASRFIGRDKGMLKDAQFLFAVSAKRAQMENNDGWASRSYPAGVRSLNNGEDEFGPGEGFLRLGLRKHMKRVSVRDLARGQLGMCNRAFHSVAVINGREEMYGRQGSAPTRGDAIALV
ncbi:MULTISPECIES: hypothetical protein [Pseudomonas]|jgi:hypothetical protein|uniref:hypothetical protein n=1 Tax=Pseudomonas TaxID=286 RepID=UPI0005B8BA56|nr:MULTISPECIES: hypothetical protein [Pseudomonas]KAA8555237.1 hypothetical protein FX984_01860 [Pseudomonas marginalis]NMZ89967.1 hypothetical protein [Pseudomonas marginalis]TWR72458.1 hypothetical protein FIV40_09810 [Pseudomonas marginalis]SCX03177.1 hypothetical protein SAMN03159437_00296 [Pseudomonas sp. NFACC25]